MALFNQLFLSFLSTILVVESIAAQTSSELGYDLEKGPVFYEAYYYPEKDSSENRRNIYQNKEEIGGGTILERSFQVPLRLDDFSPIFNEPEENLGKIPQRNYRSTYPLGYKEKIQSDKKEAYQNRLEFTKNLPNYKNTEFLNEIRTNDYPLKIEYPHKEYYQSKKYNFDNLKKFPIFPETIYIENSNINRRKIFEEMPFNDFTIREKWSLNRNFEDGSNFQETFETPIKQELKNFREFNSPNLLSNNNRRDLELKKYPNIINSVEPVIQDFSNNYENINNKLREEDLISSIEERQNEYDRLKGFSDRENIFEPRPQIIKYVFSAPRQNNLNKLQMSNLDRSRAEKSNLINSEVQKLDIGVGEKNGIASIEVSEVPRHKIRHHHGEKRMNPKNQ